MSSAASSDNEQDDGQAPRGRRARLQLSEGGSSGALVSRGASSPSLSRAASLASLADVLNGNDEGRYASLFRSAVAAVLRGAAVGGTLKVRRGHSRAARGCSSPARLRVGQGGLGLLGLRAKLRRAKAAPPGRLRAELRGAARYALFLGCYASGFRLVEGALAGVKGSRRWRAAAAGFAVAPTFVLASAHPSPSLAVYVALRAALLALRSGKRHGVAFSSRAGAALFDAGPVLTMCGSASLLLHAWLLEPRALDAAYVRFLDRHGGKGRPVIDALQELTRTGAFGAALPAARSWYAANQPEACAALDALPGGPRVPCHLVHPGRGHLSHALWFGIRGVPAALPVYLPVYAVSAALVQRSALLRQPGRVAGRAALGILRSSAFLSAYCSIAWLSCCSVHHPASTCDGRPRRMSRATVLLCAFPAGLATLLEKPSRRTELALFCAGHAAQSAARCAVLWGWVRPVRRLDVVLLCLSSGTIMHHYIHEREVFRPAFRNVFDWIFGYSWRRRGSFVSLIY